MNKFFLTKEGNLLIPSKNNTFGFLMKPNGQFIRFVLADEEAYLKEVCFSIEVREGPQIRVPQELPMWRFLWQTWNNDLSDHDPNKSSDGGNYARHNHSFFFGRMNGKNLETCCLEKTTTSSDFQTDSNGQFCDQVIRQDILGIDESTAPQEALWIDVRKKRYHTDSVVLDRVSRMISVQEALETGNSQIASNHYKSEDFISEVSKEEQAVRIEQLNTITGGDYKKFLSRRGN